MNNGNSMVKGLKVVNTVQERTIIKIPSDIRDYSSDTTRNVLEDFGIEFPFEDEGEVYRYARLPLGWSTSLADNPADINILDDMRRVRAVIMSGHDDGSAPRVNLTARFSVQLDTVKWDNKDVAVVNILCDNEHIIHNTDPLPLPQDEAERHEVSNKAHLMAYDWLDVNIPGWDGPEAWGFGSRSV